jgi:hypothetical protein
VISTLPIKRRDRAQPIRAINLLRIACFPGRHRQFFVRPDSDAAQLAFSVWRVVRRRSDPATTDLDAFPGFGATSSRLDGMNSMGGKLYLSRRGDFSLLEVSKEIRRPPAEVALNWVATQPGVTSTIIGATKISQLDSNVSSLDFTIPAELRARLQEASELDPTAQPYAFFMSTLQARVKGNAAIRAWTRDIR